MKCPWLSVVDTGEGMPPDVLARAFEPFFTTKQPGKGTGLGLSTIYGSIQQLGGTVTIYSDVGRGTSVNIYLPSVKEGTEATIAGGAAAAIPLGAGESVLLVEDNPDVREVARKRLEGLSYKVQEVESGVAAIEQLKRDGLSCDLIFSDVVMPGGMTGYDVAKWVAEHAPSIKVLLTSGYPGGLEDNIRADTTDVKLLRKPHSHAELAGALRTALDA